MKELKVCIGTSCHLKGSYNVMMCFQQLIEQYSLHESIQLTPAFCMGNCQNGVCVTFEEKLYSVSPETARSFFKSVIMEGEPQSRA